MKKEEIRFGDLNRWLFGEAPPEFMLEVFLRTIFIYLILLFIIRLLGKRMASQITITELSVMVSLGAIVSPAMQLPDRGVFFGVVVLLCALVFQRGFNYLSFKIRKIEDVLEGTMCLLIKDGILNTVELQRTKITKQQLYSMLRAKKIYNLGNVERAYLEACGILSVYERQIASAGLPTLPKNDTGILQIQKKMDGELKACSNCGNVQLVDQTSLHCQKCDWQIWSAAYKT